MDSWDPLRTFLVAASARSFLVAAKRLGVSQSTVSRHVAALVAMLGAPLFVRVGRHAELSEVGQVLLEPASQVQAAVDHFARVAEGQHPRAAGPVRIATVPELATSLLAPALPALLRTHPGVRVSVVGHVDTVSLDAREADVALRFAVPKQADLVRRKVATVGFRVAAERRVARASDPKTGPWLAYAVPLSSLPEAEWVSRRVPDERVVFRATSHETLAVACKQGLGFALLPTRTIVEEALVSVSDVVLERALYVVSHRDVLASPRVRAVFEWLVTTVSEAAARTEQAPPEAFPTRARRPARVSRRSRDHGR